MAAGLQVSKADLNSMAGSIAKDAQSIARRIKELGVYLDATNLQTAHGFTEAEEADIKSAFAASELRGVADEIQALVFAKRLIGMGIT